MKEARLEAWEAGIFNKPSMSSEQLKLYMAGYEYGTFAWLERMMKLHPMHEQNYFNSVLGRPRSRWT